MLLYKFLVVNLFVGLGFSSCDEPVEPKPTDDILRMVSEDDVNALLVPCLTPLISCITELGMDFGQVVTERKVADDDLMPLFICSYDKVVADKPANQGCYDAFLGVDVGKVMDNCYAELTVCQEDETNILTCIENEAAAAPVNEPCQNEINAVKADWTPAPTCESAGVPEVPDAPEGDEPKEDAVADQDATDAPAGDKAEKDGDADPDAPEDTVPEKGGDADKDATDAPEGDKAEKDGDADPNATDVPEGDDTTTEDGDADPDATDGTGGDDAEDDGVTTDAMEDVADDTSSALRVFASLLLPIVAWLF